MLVLLILAVAGFTSASSQIPAETQTPAPAVEEVATPDEAVTENPEEIPEWLRGLQEQSGTITCYVQCGNGSTDSGTCTNTTLAECCGWSHVFGCKFSGGYVSGYCTDGSSSLTC
jgi:hypothetical protein